MEYLFRTEAMSDPVKTVNPRGDEVYKDTEGQTYHIHYRKDLYNSYRWSFHKRGWKARFMANHDGSFEILEKKHCHEPEKQIEVYGNKADNHKNSTIKRKKRDSKAKSKSKKAELNCFIDSQDIIQAFIPNSEPNNLNSKEEEDKMKNNDDSSKKVSFGSKDNKINTRSKTARQRGASVRKHIFDYDSIEDESTLPSQLPIHSQKPKIKPRIKKWSEDGNIQKMKNFLGEEDFEKFIILSRLMKVILIFLKNGWNYHLQRN